MANQNYQNCIRTEDGYCSIAWSAAANSFQLDNANNMFGDACSTDYVTIIAAFDMADTAESNDRYCGNDLYTPQNAAAGTLFTNTRPFQLQFVTNAGEINTIDNLSVGFSLDYTQIAC